MGKILIIKNTDFSSVSIEEKISIVEPETNEIIPSISPFIVDNSGSLVKITSDTWEGLYFYVEIGKTYNIKQEWVNIHYHRISYISNIPSDDVLIENFILFQGPDSPIVGMGEANATKYIDCTFTASKNSYVLINNHVPDAISNIITLIK